MTCPTYRNTKCSAVFFSLIIILIDNVITVISRQVTSGFSMKICSTSWNTVDTNMTKKMTEIDTYLLLYTNSIKLSSSYSHTHTHLYMNFILFYYQKEISIYYTSFTDSFRLSRSHCWARCASRRLWRSLNGHAYR